jgi:hypothetical protein
VLDVFFKKVGPGIHFGKAAFACDGPGNAVLCPVRVLKKSAQEGDYLAHIGSFLLGRFGGILFVGPFAAHARSQKHPERFLDVIVSGHFPMPLVKHGLLIKDEKPSHHKLMGLFSRSFLKVQDTEGLAVAVAVKIAVGVIEKDGLAVGRKQLFPHPSCG